MRINSRYFSPDIRKVYSIDDIIVEDGYLYVDTNKGMYGMKQAAIISYLQFVKKTWTEMAIILYIALQVYGHIAP